MIKGRIKSNLKYWHTKIEKNIDRDKRVNQQLQIEGWILVRYWDHQIMKDLQTCADEIEALVRERRAENAAWYDRK